LYTERKITRTENVPELSSFCQQCGTWKIYEAESFSRC
jgi:hypothetical protein